MERNIYPILINQVEVELSRLRLLVDKSRNGVERAMLLTKINSYEQKLERLKKKNDEKM